DRGFRSSIPGLYFVGAPRGLEFRTADAVRFRHGVYGPCAGQRRCGQQGRPDFIGEISMGKSSQVAEVLVSCSGQAATTDISECHAPEWLLVSTACWTRCLCCSRVL